MNHLEKSFYDEKNKKMKKRNNKKIFLILIIWITIWTLICLFLSFTLKFDNFLNETLNKFIWGESENVNIENTTGTVLEIVPEYSTWDSVEFPEEPRAMLDYWMKYWTWWTDYIVASPENQPNMDSKYWAVNTDKMHKYLYQNRIKFEIKDTEREWYIMFITTYPINKNSKLFLWLDWSTVWWLDTSRILYTENKNEFLYSLNEINLIWNSNYHFSKNLSWKSTISINAVVWEAWNKVEKIIIFFK